MRAMTMTNWSMTEPCLTAAIIPAGIPMRMAKKRAATASRMVAGSLSIRATATGRPMKKESAQVAPEDSGYPAVELDVQRFVEAQVLPELLYLLGGGIGPQHHRRWIAGNNGMRRKETTATRTRTGIKLKTRRMMYAPTLSLLLNSHFGGRPSIARRLVSFVQPNVVEVDHDPRSIAFHVFLPALPDAKVIELDRGHILVEDALGLFIGSIAILEGGGSHALLEVLDHFRVVVGKEGSPRHEVKVIGAWIEAGGVAGEEDVPLG